MVVASAEKHEEVSWKTVICCVLCWVLITRAYVVIKAHELNTYNMYILLHVIYISIKN